MVTATSSQSRNRVMLKRCRANQLSSEAIDSLMCRLWGGVRSSARTTAVAADREVTKHIILLYNLHSTISVYKVFPGGPWTLINSQ